MANNPVNPLTTVPTKQVPQVIRGCRTRRAGMVYMATSEKWFKDYPLSYFLFDPPILVENPTAWGLSAQGISYVNKGGVIHAQDWIGRGTNMHEGGYWNAADVLEELVNIGGSGLVPLNPQIGQLTDKSRRLLFHPAGFNRNPKPYKEDIQRNLPDCKQVAGSKEYEYHKAENDLMCSMMHWQWVEGAERQFGRNGIRTIGQTRYGCAMPIEGEKPDFALALIAWLPIDELQIVQGDEDRVAKAVELLGKISNLPFFVTNA